MKRTIFLAVSAITMFLFSGCGTESRPVGKISPITENLSPRQTVVAKYTSKPITIDGKLDEPQWQNVTQYPLTLPRDRQQNGMTIKENGHAMFCRDANYLYLGVKFRDSDVIATGKGDNMHHYNLGDVCELFAKPLNQPYYWELYVTPTGQKTAFFFPFKGHIPIAIDNDFCQAMQVAANVSGTVNNSSDTDKGWTAEIAVPLKQLDKYAAKFKAGQSWTTLVGRYNYSKSIESDPALSAMPEISVTSWHSTHEYAIIELVK
jgi:hypothetical protein